MKTKIQLKTKKKKIAPKPYMLLIPFPQQLAKGKLTRRFGEFLEVLKKLYIYIPFNEDLSQMPSYAKFLKEVLFRKGKLEDYETMALIEECNALIQRKLPPKPNDLGSFSIPCN